MSSDLEARGRSRALSLALKASYLLLVASAIVTSVRVFVPSSGPTPSFANGVIAALALPSSALLVWPWPKSRLSTLHAARAVSGVAFSVAVFVLPILLDHGQQETRELNVGVLTFALIVHGLVVLVSTEGIQRAVDQDQKDLAATCRQILQRVERLESTLDARNQAVLTEVQALTDSLERRERAQAAKAPWFRRIRR